MASTQEDASELNMGTWFCETSLRAREARRITTEFVAFWMLRQKLSGAGSSLQKFGPALEFSWEYGKESRAT